MKKLSVVLALTFAAGISLFAQKTTPTMELPELHTIKSVTLGPSYSCRPPEQFARGYENTALYLSSYSKERKSPDLLFNGACNADNYFEASMSGDDMSLIADLGKNLSIEEVTASRAFNLKRVHSFGEYSRFVRNTKVQPNHTYAVLLNQSNRRGLFIFTVVNYVPNERVELRYAVKSYEVMPHRSQFFAAGFDWERTNN